MLRDQGSDSQPVHWEPPPGPGDAPSRPAATRAARALDPTRTWRASQFLPEALLLAHPQPIRTLRDCLCWVRRNRTKDTGLLLPRTRGPGPRWVVPSVALPSQTLGGSDRAGVPFRPPRLHETVHKVSLRGKPGARVSGPHVMGASHVPAWPRRGTDLSQGTRPGPGSSNVQGKGPRSQRPSGT